MRTKLSRDSSRSVRHGPIRPDRTPATPTHLKRPPAWSRSLPLQFSLKVNRPGDGYEQEAERVAGQVMRMPASQQQRKTCACGRPAGPDGMCAECKRKQVQIQRKVTGDGGQTTAPPIVHQVLRAPGRPLEASTRNFMESRFGQGFSQVRIHTGDRAAASAQAVAAQAYTVGHNVVLGKMRHPLRSREGKRLLAHELTHVVQQRTASPAAIRVQRIPPEDPTLWAEARRASEAGEGSTGTGSSTVYICAKDLDTSPVGRHAFFRIGAPGAGNPTISLQPIDTSGGSDCWQGVPARNYPSDHHAQGDCDPTPITLECLEREFRAYPIGHYCTWGPNSNTFVGHVARACGVANPDPTGWTPGIDDSPPPSGTYAPDKWTTLTGCVTKECSSPPAGS